MLPNKAGATLLACFSSVVCGEEHQDHSELFILKPYRTNYVLPVRYSASPDYEYFAPLNPHHRKSKKTEFEFQISLRVAILESVLRESDSLEFAYTQNAYWQVYDKSAYFRDTDYQPEVFYTLPVNRQWGSWQWHSSSVGVWHESNGKGGIHERSWNRVFVNFRFENGPLTINLKPWVRLELAHDYNTDVSKYRGHGEIELLFQWRNGHQLLAKSRNDIESGFSRGYEEIGWLFPIYGNLKGFIKLTSGYGESISTYNHYDNAAGIGIALSGFGSYFEN